MSRDANPDHPIHELIAKRWSPVAFSDRAVSRDDVLSLFEAARWAPSSYNEQPWRYLVAVRDEPEAFERILSCLVPPNQAWAKAAPVLAIGVASTRFARNGKENRHGFHDLGAATANLSTEATARGLAVHQMAGILPDHAREALRIPGGHEAVTGIAIGYPAEDPSSLPDDLRERDSAPRSRKPLGEILFGAEWGARW